MRLPVRRYQRNITRATGLAEREEQCSGLFEGICKTKLVPPSENDTSTISSRSAEVANIMELCCLMCLASGEKLEARLQWLFKTFKTLERGSLSKAVDKEDTDPSGSTTNPDEVEISNMNAIDVRASSQHPYEDSSACLFSSLTCVCLLSTLG